MTIRKMTWCNSSSGKNGRPPSIAASCSSTPIPPGSNPRILTHAPISSLVYDNLCIQTTFRRTLGLNVHICINPLHAQRHAAIKKVQLRHWKPLNVQLKTCIRICGRIIKETRKATTMNVSIMVHTLNSKVNIKCGHIYYRIRGGTIAQDH